MPKATGETFVYGLKRDRSANAPRLRAPSNTKDIRVQKGGHRKARGICFVICKKVYRITFLLYSASWGQTCTYEIRNRNACRVG